MATTKPRVTITVDEETYNEIEAFRKEQRMLTISQAARQIMIVGMRALEKELKEERRRHGEKSGDFLHKP